ncbi:4-(cytidine 5'-diphospho)-2-C-methyl-D-erythritol kinase [Anaeromicropila populeti]|uniref:4-diphosphocytidyl-2-C-methyl-D-erythritol kinase n=1 Tax=Anaeromicropila populeti TaxID=37658 RepID=A0A1I6I673_9FIRM|nr:4-(cytidine 5'-diphospho)-2-C-methyl-D-erythritol kinase [Anaeromicropila populeti]SFR62201.1 4-diphosphocytidyl-2-C-methyl-D-erythritol kinase [Anaeromicropila populeti]
MYPTIQKNAYGKINIGLDVLRKREDGYHEVRMIMQTVTLFDRLHVTVIPNDTINIETNLSFLPTNENNLVYSAVKLLKDEFSIKEGLSIKLDKYIPVAAGMAGGSADAAAALEIMNELFSLGLTQSNLMERAVKLGADVPYCIMKGTALSEGIGEILTPLPPLTDCFILIVKPNIHVSTKYVYENLRLDTITSHPDIDGIIYDIRRKDIRGMALKMNNVLESVTEKDYPVICQIKNLMIAQGAIHSIMSGSGPTVFGIFQSHSAIEKAHRFFREDYPMYKSYIVKPIRP